MRTRWIVLLAGLALLAGCLQGTDPDAGSEPDDDQNLEPADESSEGERDGGSTTADGASSQAAQSASWQEEQRTGSLSQTHAVDPVEESFDVAEGTMNLTINVSAEGPSPFVFVYPPGCEAGPLPPPYNEPTSERCYTSACVEEPGTAFATGGPEAGGWTVRIETCAIALNPTPTGSYELVIAQLRPA